MESRVIIEDSMSHAKFNKLLHSKHATASSSSQTFKYSDKVLTSCGSCQLCWWLHLSAAVFNSNMLSKRLDLKQQLIYSSNRK